MTQQSQGQLTSTTNESIPLADEDGAISLLACNIKNELSSLTFKPISPKSAHTLITIANPRLVLHKCCILFVVTLLAVAVIKPFYSM